MRNFGGVLMLIGLFGFIYCASQLDKYEPVPEGKGISESLHYEAGKWDVARYACAGVAGFGLLMFFFPKGR
jgi:hypothetical protein